jgi:hypothetical protein
MNEDSTRSELLAIPLILVIFGIGALVMFAATEGPWAAPFATVAVRDEMDKRAWLHLRHTTTSTGRGCARPRWCSLRLHSQPRRPRRLQSESRGTGSP